MYCTCLNSSVGFVCYSILAERVAHDEREILWSQHTSHSDEHDTNRKLNSSSENISLFMPKEVKQRSSSIQVST